MAVEARLISLVDRFGNLLDSGCFQKPAVAVLVSMKNILTAPTLDHPSLLLPNERLMGSIEGSTVVEVPGLYIRWVAPMRIDGDGRGLSHGDPDFQAVTSFRPGGKSLNADDDPYVVVSGLFKQMFGGYYLGYPCEVYDLYTRQFVRAVVGDVGPKGKLGEASIACAKALQIPSSPTNGGESERRVHYVLHLSNPPAFFMANATQGHVSGN